FLDVGLQMKNGVAIAGEALACEFVKLRLHEWPGLLFGDGQDLAVETLVECGIARKDTAVEQREGKLGVVLFNARALFDCAAGRADAKAKIPERARKLRDQRAKILLGLFAAKDEEKVKIGMGKEETPSIAAEGQ